MLSGKKYLSGVELFDTSGEVERLDVPLPFSSTDTRFNASPNARWPISANTNAIPNGTRSVFI
jgi:hypothetical protein